MKQNQTTAGLTLIELLVIIAVIALFAAMIQIPRPGDKAKARRISCTNNLKQVGLAFRTWTGDSEMRFSSQVSVTNGGAMEAVLGGNVSSVFQVMSNQLVSPKILLCPTDKKRIQATTFDRSDPSIGTRGSTLFGSNTNLSYFVGLDAIETSPEMFLTGDDNLLVGGKPAPTGILSLTTNTPIAWSETRHEKQGNVGLADGSVQGFSSSALRNALANTGVETNRLAMP